MTADGARVGGPSRVTIRPATRADLAAVAEIERLSFTDPWSAESFATLLGDPRVHFAVADAGAERSVAGYLVAWFVAGEAEIANLAVAPWARGAGLGASLLDAALAAARARGAAAVFLEVRDSNLAARRLYASRGFVSVGRRRNYYRRPVEDALVLRCDLPPSGSPG